MDRFRVLERIGSGGMGTVYRAYDERLERQVAVKADRPIRTPDRVLREAQAAARLNHPAIVTLYELGEHAGHAVLVSELVPGETLAEPRGRRAGSTTATSPRSRPTSARRSPTRTRAASSTATSSLRT